MRVPAAIGAVPPLLALLAGVACASAPTRPAPTGEPVVAIRVEQPESGGDWRVSWELPVPVSEAPFARGDYPDRARRWRVATPGVAIVTEDGVDRLRSSSGPVSRVEVRIAPYAVKPEKDYQLLVPFTDGDVLVYTGAFELAVPGRGEAPPEPPWRNVFTFVPRPGQGVVVGGRRTDGPATWPSREGGTYACLGAARPVETSLGLAVVDAGMPAWLRDRTLDLAPRVFALYATGTGERLDVRPTFFLSYGADPGPDGYSFGGGTLEGVVQLDTRLAGRHLAASDAEVWTSQARLLAHEAAHLWLDHAFEPADDAGRWLDEGGADAFAFRALLDLAVVDRARWLELVSDDATACLRQLESGPLSGAARAGRWKALYRCGAVASLLADAVGAAGSPPRDLLAFWGGVFRASPGGRYGESLWLLHLESMPGGREAAAVVRRMVAAPDASLPADLVAILRRAGAEARLEGSPPSVRISSWPGR